MTQPQEESCVPGPEQHAWEGGTLSWEIFYLIVFAAVLVIVLVSTPGSTLVATAAVVGLLLWYLFLGRPLWTHRAAASRLRVTIYVVGLFALFGVAQSQNPEVWFLAFALAPQFFSFMTPRMAIATGIALNFYAAALLVARYPSASTAAVAFGVAVAGGGFSLFYGSWVARIIGQSAERAQIIEQLEATQAELAAAQHEAGRMAERQRLSADIHDTLAQGFTSILMLIQAAQADLAPAQLEGGTLPDALRRLSQVPGVDAGFSVCGTARQLPMATEVVLLRVCQEALANVRKHAGADKASVELRYDPRAVLLEVIDDGAGFDPDRVTGGYGLRGMRTRVAEAGGTVTVHSSPGAGTRVCVTVPA